MVDSSGFTVDGGPPVTVSLDVGSVMDGSVVAFTGIVAAKLPGNYKENV